MFNSQVKGLFDTGASNSFIAIRIVRRFGLVPQTLDVSLNAISPLGVSVKLGKVCKDCLLNWNDQNFPSDLIVLSMKEFDVILGIDWLTKYSAKLDCVSKSISFSMTKRPLFNFQCKPSCDVFLTSCLATLGNTSTELTISQIPIVRDFEDVFQDISLLPPPRDIGFYIELVPSTLPLSKTLYRIAPTEM